MHPFDPPLSAYLRPLHPPLVPEVRLYLATGLIDLWGSLRREDDGALLPYWAWPWAGGQAVARYILDHPDEVRGRTVFDLAGGSGLCAIAALVAGATHATTSDIDPRATAACTANARLNRVALTVSTGNPLAGTPPRVDVILAGDIFYDRTLAGSGLAWLRRAASQGTRVLVGDPGRTYSSPDSLLPLAHYQVPGCAPVEDRDVKPVTVATLP